MVQGPVSKITTAKWTQGVAQEIENLLCKHQVLSSNSSHKKKKKKDYQLQLKTHCVLELIKASPHQNNFDYKEFDRS
jgi:hypothetical protein